MGAIASQIANHLFRRRSKKISKLRVTGLCAWNSPGSGEFPAQMASNAENVSIWWRHREWQNQPVPNHNKAQPRRKTKTSYGNLCLGCRKRILRSTRSKTKSIYRQVSNIRHTKSQHLEDSRTVLRLSLPNPLKPDVKSRMKIWVTDNLLLTKVRLILEVLLYIYICN